jgi:hypothetical protein
MRLKPKTSFLWEKKENHYQPPIFEAKEELEIEKSS